MARNDLLQTNFVGGELSPRLYGRPDLARYADSVKQARDVVILQHGGARGRPGTDFIREVKDSANFTRLIPFVYSSAQAYMLEHGDQYLRVHQGTTYHVEVASPYTTAQIADVDWSQGADTMLLTHQQVTPYRLQRWGNTRWVLEAAPFSEMPFDAIGHYQSTVVTLGATSGSTTATAAAAAWMPADVGRTISYLGGQATITAYTSSTVVDVTVTTAFTTTTLPANGWRLNGSPQTQCTPGANSPIGALITATLAMAGWRSTDVGKFIRINGGVLKITTYSSTTVVGARVQCEMASASSAGVDAWTLESVVWNEVDGYPRCVSLHEQRLVFANTPAKPQTVWGSRIALYYDFTPHVLDDDGYSFDLASDQVNPILGLVSGRDLVALTHAGTWAFAGGVEKPISPTNVRARLLAKTGADDARTEEVEDDLVYLQRARGVLRSLRYVPEVGSYDDDEASALFEHLVVDMAGTTYQPTPERVLWAWRDDGSYLAITWARKQNNLRAAALCTPAGGGVVECMTTIPEDGDDATYLIVRRTINGSTKRYIERINWDAHQDCRVVVTNSPASTTVSGLSHLEGKTVAAVADGVDLGDFVVSAGAITLPRAASSISVGLRYVPTLQLLQPEFGTGMGASLGSKTARGETRLLFKDTIGCNVNGVPLAFRQFGTGVLDEAVEPFSGWMSISGLGVATDSGEVTLTQPQAYPWTVLAVVRKMVANPG